MDKNAIEKIVELSQPNIINENGYTYSDKQLYVIEDPRVGIITFKTLRGLTDTLKSEHAKFQSPLIINVTEHNEVCVYSAIFDSDRHREEPYASIADIPNIDFGRLHDYETMMITLKSKFVETPELLDLVQTLGTITNENNSTMADDGFSQTVTTRKGIAMKDNKTIKPIIKLRPFRTFIEVEQPESEFLLRLHDGMRVALYEADGGAWKLQARKSVAEFLKEQLSDLIENKEVIITE